MSEVKTLGFGITGEFVTKIAREWFFLEGKEYKVVEDLLLSCMGGTDTPEGELKLMAQDILLGKAEFRGNSADDTFRYVTLDAPTKTNLFTEYSKARQEVKRLKNALADTDKQYGNLLDALRSWWEGNAEEALEIVESKDVKELLLDLMAMYDEVSIVYKPGYGRIAKFPDSEDEVVVRKATGDPLLDSYFEQRSSRRNTMTTTAGWNPMAPSTLWNGANINNSPITFLWKENGWRSMRLSISTVSPMRAIF